MFASTSGTVGAPLEDRRRGWVGGGGGGLQRRVKCRGCDVGTYCTHIRVCCALLLLTYEMYIPVSKSVFDYGDCQGMCD